MGQEILMARADDGVATIAAVMDGEDEAAERVLIGYRFNLRSAIRDEDQRKGAKFNALHVFEAKVESAGTKS